MKKIIIAPYLFLLSCYVGLVGYLYACFTLWYSDIPERIAVAQHYLQFTADAILAVIGAIGILVVFTGGIVMYKIQVINKTWFMVYLITPLILGLMLMEIIYLMFFVE